MKLKHHIDATNSYLWLRPSQVFLKDGNLECHFQPPRYYELQDSYRLSPHARFLNARTDSEMRTFVRAWGPLNLRLDQPLGEVVTQPLPEYHALRKWLDAYVGLMEAIEKAANERGSVQSYIEAEEDRYRCSQIYDPNRECFPLQQLRSHFGIPGSLSEWVARASTAEIRPVIQFIVEVSALAPLSRLKVVHEDKHSVVKAQWLLSSLETALLWMVWYDVYRKDPLYCCQECRRFFKSDSRHERKFCNNPRCARRVAARNWRKKDLEKKRLAKQQLAERKPDGAHKAR